MSFNVIGLGKAGCNLANLFKQYPQYKVYCIDSYKEQSDKKKKKNYYHIPEQSSPEEYEKNIISLKTFFRGIKGEVLFILGGGGFISGASLMILEQLKENCKINILYIKPEIDLLSETKTLQEKVVYNVLQEYARSAVFECMYIVHNSVIENFKRNELTILNYYEKINELIVSTFHMINVFQNSESIMESFSVPLPTTRIATFGVVDINSGEERLFFDIKNIKEKDYYYAINDKKIRNDTSLLQEIKTQLKEKKTKDSKVSFGVYSTPYEDDYSFCLVRSPVIQK